MILIAKVSFKELDLRPACGGPPPVRLSSHLFFGSCQSLVILRRNHDIIDPTSDKYSQGLGYV